MKMELRKRAIDKVYKRRDRIEMPDFQREEVWNRNKKQLLIDSILNGWHLPKLYFRKAEDNSFECVDGQQRLSAIFEFFEDQLPLSLDSQARFKAEKYSQLPDDLSDKFDDFELDIEEIEDIDDVELEELFARLQLGTPLNTAEKLNAISGELREFCHDVSKKDYFANKISLRNSRYAHFEIALKWIFIEARGILPQMRFPQLESFLKENRTFSRQSETAKIIISAIEFLESAFTEKSKMLRSRANVLSICMLASKVITQKLDRNTSETFGNFVDTFFNELSIEVEKGRDSTEKELIRYQNAISTGSADGPSIQRRINILTKRLATYSTVFSPLIGAYAEVEDEAKQNLSEMAELAKNNIYSLNRKYSAGSGEELFKMTTDSSESIGKLNIPCKDKTSFENFVDSLYFLIYEGSGSCKRLPDPPPTFAMDIKFLRTSIRHDLNHGKFADIKKKQMRSAEIFRKYSGKSSLGECSPEEIFSAQLRIINELCVFLNKLCTSPVG